MAWDGDLYLHMNWYLLYSTYAFTSDVFCDSSMMTNDNRRIWDCLSELLKTELWLFMRFLIHQTWYLLIMISPILLWHVWLFYYPSQSDSRIHSSSPTSASDSSRWLEETSCWSFKWTNSERRTVRLLVLGMWLLLIFFWFRYHFSL